MLGLTVLWLGLLILSSMSLSAEVTIQGAWSRDQLGTCPESQPDLGSACDQEGLHCDYGSQECCGQLYPELSMQCDGGAWQGYYVDTLCVLGNVTDDDDDDDDDEYVNMTALTDNLCRSGPSLSRGDNHHQPGPSVILSINCGNVYNVLLVRSAYRKGPGG